VAPHIDADKIRGMATVDISVRFWSKVEKTSSCWLWTASTAGQGYGYFHISGGGNRRVRTYAHRWSYESAKGPIPPGLTIDHLCRVLRCVNPDHLEAVTLRENQRRRTGFKRGPYDVGAYCRRGHERTTENTYINPHGVRSCRPCGRIATAKYAAMRRMSTP
jgi:hypothetical protein